jgi:hypothetical protein
MTVQLDLGVGLNFGRHTDGWRRVSPRNGCRDKPPLGVSSHPTKTVIPHSWLPFDLSPARGV